MHHSRRFGRLALLLAVSAFAAPTLSAQIIRRDTMPAAEVKALEFAGVTKAVDIDELKASIFTEATRCRSAFLVPICKFSRFHGFEKRSYLNRTELARDILRMRVFYFKHGYRDAQVDTAVSDINEHQVAVKFIVVEGPPTLVTDVSVNYDSTLIRRRRMRSLTLLTAGKPLDLFVMDSTRVAFQNELWELGFADALIDTSTVVDEAARTARVQFRLVKNRRTTVGDITIQGTDKVAPTVVLNSIPIRPGDVYKRSTVLESQRNLYESNLFRLAVLQVPTTFDSVKNVNILLREAQLHDARISGGFTTIEYFQTDARYTAYNLLGGARRLDITGALGNIGGGSLNNSATDSSVTGNEADFKSPTWQVSAELRQPAWLQRPRNAISIGAFAQRRAVPSVVIDRGYGGNLTFTRTLAIRAPASLSYHFEVTRVQANGPYFCVNFGVCDTTTVDLLRTHQRLSPLQAQVQVDRSDNPLSPTRGYTARGILEHASAVTVSDYRYNRATGEATLYTRLGQRSAVFASHIRLGFVRPMSGSASSGGLAVLHPRTRYYAGGSQSVRGYGENQLGPRVLTLPREYLVHALTTSGAPCDASSEAIQFCDPNTARDTGATDGVFGLVGDDKFMPRPLGGTSLVEASVEYRFPLPFFGLGAAVFLDGAAVGERIFDPLGEGVKSLADLVRGTGAITPGFGVRYMSSVGPIRVDLGFNPSRAEQLAVVTEVVRNGRREIIALKTPKTYSPVGTGGGVGALLNRFTLHLSIGQAY